MFLGDFRESFSHLATTTVFVIIEANFPNEYIFFKCLISSNKYNIQLKPGSFIKWEMFFLRYDISS